jgi:Ser/Thr protein kinase RdoA (MazF antagonist)
MAGCRGLTVWQAAAVPDPAGPPPRDVTLVLCDDAGTVLGALPPFEVGFPFWPEVADIVHAARERVGLDVVVLRLLHAVPVPDGPSAGGPVTYLAQTAVPLTHAGAAPEPAPFPDGAWSADHPLRLPYARPGGPQAALAWADAALERTGSPRNGAAEQIKTWNLSTIWHLPTASGPAWLKVVPPFLAHEGAVIEYLRSTGHADVVPRPVAVDGGRLLMAQIPGQDQFGATGGALLSMVRALVPIQAALVGHVPDLLALGAPDWRPDVLAGLVESVAARAGDQLDDDIRAELHRLVDALPQRFADLAACGLPDTLVHGDFHPGNVRLDGSDSSPASSRGQQLTILDWGDSGIGHPLFDQSAFCERLGDEDRDACLREWRRLWQAAVPGCDPDRAGDLLAPLSCLRRAAIYQGFLDRIEPSEHVYHASDPADWLAEAVRTRAL